MSKSARAEGSKLIFRKLEETRNGQGNDLPVILTGDFNCAPGSLPHRNFTEDGFVDTYLAAANDDVGGSHTFHAFRGSRYPARSSSGSGRIDWILLRDQRQRIQTKSQLIVRDCHEETGIYPSDHYPILAEFVLGNRSTKARLVRAS